jgi:hypothetical protein
MAAVDNKGSAGSAGKDSVGTDSADTGPADTDWVDRERAGTGLADTGFLEPDFAAVDFVETGSVDIDSADNCSWPYSFRSGRISIERSAPLSFLVAREYNTLPASCNTKLFRLPQHFRRIIRKQAQIRTFLSVQESEFAFLPFEVIGPPTVQAGGSIVKGEQLNKVGR